MPQFLTTIQYTITDTYIIVADSPEHARKMLDKAAAECEASSDGRVADLVQYVRDSGDLPAELESGNGDWKIISVVPAGVTPAMRKAVAAVAGYDVEDSEIESILQDYLDHSLDDLNRLLASIEKDLDDSGGDDPVAAQMRHHVRIAIAAMTNP